MVGLYRYSTTNLLHFLLSVLSSWMIHTTENKYAYTSRVPGLTEHLLPTFAGVVGNPLHSVLSLYGVGG